MAIENERPKNRKGDGGRAARILTILMKLKAQGKVLVSELANDCGVSEVSIRQDLDWLEEQNLVPIERFHGGARLNALQGTGQRTYSDIRRKSHSREKAAMAAYIVQHLTDQNGVKLIDHGSKLVLDSGTTVEAIAQEIKSQELRGIHIVSNSAVYGSYFLDYPDPESVYVQLGGALSRSAPSYVDINSDRLTTDDFFKKEAGNFLERSSGDFTAIISANAYSDGHILANSKLTTSFKQELIKAANKTIIVLDHSKFLTKAPEIVAEFEKCGSEGREGKEAFVVVDAQWQNGVQPDEFKKFVSEYAVEDKDSKSQREDGIPVEVFRVRLLPIEKKKQS